MPISFGSSGIGGVFYGSTPIKEVYAGSQLVWSAELPAQGFFVTDNSGYYYRWIPAVSTWGSLVVPPVSDSSPRPVALSSYPGTVITGNGIQVPAGTYTITVWARPSSSNNYQKGVRATLNGAAIPGLQVLQTTSSNGEQKISATVTIGAGTVSIQAYRSDGAGPSYIRTGLAGSGTEGAFTGLTIVPV